MVVIPAPSLPEALIRHTKACPDLFALVGHRVSHRPNAKSDANPRGWEMPCYAIVWQISGGPGDHADLKVMRTLRVDAWCYGEKGFMAEDLYLLLDAYMAPQQDVSWVENGCRVWDVHSGPYLSRPDPAGNWPRVIGQYTITYARIPS